MLINFPFYKMVLFVFSSDAKLDEKWLSMSSCSLLT